MRKSAPSNKSATAEAKTAAASVENNERSPIESKNRFILVLTALGVVFGDIATSPIYAMRETLVHLDDAGWVARDVGILGALSVIVWSLILIMTVKYLCFILKADNQGEGGIFALLALGHKKPKVSGKKTLTIPMIIILGGAAMMYGDGVITPAISVLSAAEGLPMIDPMLDGHAVSVAVVILLALFYFQKFGTTKIGFVFGPVMLIWLLLLGGFGLFRLSQNWSVLAAFNPWYAIRLLEISPKIAMLILGTSVLAITGVEALYADLGHFGRKAITRAWVWIAMPCILLNYFGQAGLAINHPELNLEILFQAIAPAGFLRIILVVASIIATMIASQALITGAFSLTSQAMQLGYFPRLRIKHTSGEMEGQIYIPLVNWLLGIGVIMMVIAFKQSGALAGAYGMAVTLTMLISTFAFYFVMRVWEWGWWKITLFCLVFGTIDLFYFGANLLKFTHGGWLPVVIGSIVMTIMLVWKRGRSYIGRKIAKEMIEPELLLKEIRAQRIVRVPGEAVFMSANPNGVPIVLLHHLKWNKCLHETVLLFSLVTTHQPTVHAKDRYEITDLGEGIWRSICYQGYMENLHLPTLIKGLAEHDVPIKAKKIVYYFNRENVVFGKNAPMMHWEKELYRILSQNARPAKDFYQAPPNQIVEIGLPVVL